MIYETYVCSLADGRDEYGFTFKEHPDTDDTVFDIVIGVLSGDTAEDLHETEIQKMEADWRKYEWAAKAICEAADTYKKPLCKCYDEEGNDTITGECNDCGRIIKAEAP